MTIKTIPWTLGGVTIQLQKSDIIEGIDETAMRELELFIDNDADLYCQQVIPMILNVARKLNKGTYDDTLAPKLWQYLVDNGAKKYNKQFGIPGTRQTIFNKSLRMALAKQYADHYKTEILSGNYSELLASHNIKNVVTL